MHRPPAFAVDDVDELHGLLDAGAPAHLVTAGPDGLAATVVPLVLDRGRGPLGTLRGHLARANDQWRGLGDGAPALAVVGGPDAYVSPSWYPSKAADGRVVPTWNYVVVHAHGTLSAVEDPAWIEQQVRDLTDRHEAGRAEPWSVDDAPVDHVAAKLRGIVGVELVIERLEGARKLSQNRPADHDAVRDALAAGDARQQEVAAAMGWPGPTR